MLPSPANPDDKVCSYCGQPLDARLYFCTRCSKPFRAVETVPADQKASVLSANIARAMWFTLIGFVFDAIALVALLVVTFGRRSAR